MRAETAPRFVIDRSEGRISLAITPVVKSPDIINPLIEADKALQEKCGIAAIFSPTMPIETKMKTLLRAGEGVQHRGQQGAGFALPKVDGQVHRYTGEGFLEEAIPQTAIQELPDTISNSWAVLHTRYGTDGGYNPMNFQPAHTVAPDGTQIAVAHNGNFAAKDRMRKLAGGDYPEDVSDTFLFTEMLANMPGDNWDEKVQKAIMAAPGAASLFIGIGDVLYVARDEKGVRPLIIGEVDGAFMAASETLAFDQVGGHVDRKIRAGEILRVDANGITSLQEGREQDKGFCAIEIPYFSHKRSKNPDSRNPEEWKEYAAIRHDIGRRIAQEEQAEREANGQETFRPDFVVGIESSGVEFAEGYADAMGVPIKQILTRNPEFRKRLFQDDQDIAAISAQYTDKLLLDPDIDLEGASIVLVDDSAIRGSLQKNVTKRLKERGVKEVHWRLGFPPIENPCHLGVSLRSHEELIAWQHDGDMQAIASAVGADSVRYISDEGFVRAIKNGRFVEPMAGEDVYAANGICGGCTRSGEYAVPLETYFPQAADVFVANLAASH